MSSSEFEWASAIRSAYQHSRFRHALSLYLHLHRTHCGPTSFALSAALKAYARLPSEPTCAAIHAQAHKLGQAHNVYIQTSLIDLYSKSGHFHIARKVFDEMPHRNVVSWNSILVAYIRAGDVAAAQKMFDEMPAKDVFSWNSIISSYAKAGDIRTSMPLWTSSNTCHRETPHPGTE